MANGGLTPVPRNGAELGHDIKILRVCPGNQDCGTLYWPHALERHGAVGFPHWRHLQTGRWATFVLILAKRII